MKREFLKNLGLTDEQVNQIMTENGNDIEKYRKEVESKTKELETLNTKYESAQNSLNDANKSNHTRIWILKASRIQLLNGKRNIKMKLQS
jgi:peptidoglycan hydrolase CwlO-like protein